MKSHRRRSFSFLCDVDALENSRRGNAGGDLSEEPLRQTTQSKFDIQKFGFKKAQWDLVQ